MSKEAHDGSTAGTSNRQPSSQLPAPEPLWPSAPPDAGSVVLGIFLVLAFHVAVLFKREYLPWIGVLQALYVVPLFCVSWVRQKWLTMAGIALCAGFTLLSAGAAGIFISACFGLG